MLSVAGEGLRRLAVGLGTLSCILHAFDCKNSEDFGTSEESDSDMMCTKHTHVQPIVMLSNLANLIINSFSQVCIFK